MAKAASSDRVSADMRPTDYRGAVKRMEAIAAKTAKQKAMASEIGDIYDKVAGVCGVDKRAAKIFHAISKMEPEDQLLVFRDINGLLDASGVMEQGADLVDKSQDKVVKMRFRTKAAEADAAEAAGGEGEGEGIDEEIEEIADDGSQAGGDDDFTEMSDEELAQQQSRKQTGEDPEPFTGDNSDLND